MDVIGAFQTSLDSAIVEDAGGDDSPEGTSIAHLQDMLARMIADDTMPDDKRNRWLGWAQGVLAAHGCLTLDQCKAINEIHRLPQSPTP